MSQRAGTIVPLAPSDAWAAFAVAGVITAGAAGPLLFARSLHAAFGAGIPGTVVAVRTDVEVAFDVPAGADFIRIDIPAVPGDYRVGGVAIDGAAVPGLASRRLGSDLPATGGPRYDEAIHIHSASSRATFELDLRGLASGPVQLVVSLRRELRGDPAVPVLGEKLDALAEYLRGETEALQQYSLSMQRQLRQCSDAADAVDRNAAARAEANAGHVQRIHESLAGRIDQLQVQSADVVDRNAAARAEANAGHLQRVYEILAGRIDQLAVVNGTSTSELGTRLDAIHALGLETGMSIPAITAAAIDPVRDELASLRAEVRELTGLVREGMLRRVLKRLRLMPR